MNKICVQKNDSSYLVIFGYFSANNCIILFFGFHFLLLLLLLLFCLLECGILVPSPGIKPVAPSESAEF